MLKIIKPFIDLLFPIECINCNQEDIWLCNNCLEKIKLLKNWSCPVCKIGLTQGRVCCNCQDKSFLNGAIIAAAYEDKLIDKAIHYLKYKVIKDLAKQLGEILIKILQQADFWQDDWILIPVPLHPRRQRFRGFNQAELIGGEIEEALGLKMNVNNLYRIRHTESQIKLHRQERLKNVINAFKIKNPDIVSGKKIILLDDVMTTGATLQECAKALKKAGASEVWAVVLARGV